MKIGTISKVIICNVKLWAYRYLHIPFKIVPYKILVNLTNRCNSRCSYCDIWKHDNFEDEICLDNLISLFDDMGDSLIWLALSGGEVTLVKYLDQMILEAKKRCKNLSIISFTTNGLLPEKVLKIALDINKTGLESIVTISLDGDEELHDKSRGVKGNYIKATNLYGMLKEHGVNVNYGITANGDNKEFIFNKYRSMRHQIKAVTFVHNDGIYGKENSVDSNKIAESLRHICQNYVLDSIAEIIELIHLKISVLFVQQKGEHNLIPCEVIDTSLHVMPNGDIHPCMYLDAIGNIKKDHVQDLMTSDHVKTIKEKIKKDQCPHCWMNCYSPYSIMAHPLYSLYYLFKKCNH